MTMEVLTKIVDKDVCVCLFIVAHTTWPSHSTIILITWALLVLLQDNFGCLYCLDNTKLLVLIILDRFQMLILWHLKLSSSVLEFNWLLDGHYCLNYTGKKGNMIVI